MNDSISRQAAVDALCDNCGNPKPVCAHYPCNQYLAIEALPPAQTERKKGKWLESQDPINVTGTCSCCGWDALLYETDVAGMPYCPNCGAAMEGGEAECSLIQTN